jgi:hypothetical protein
LVCLASFKSNILSLHSNRIISIISINLSYLSILSGGGRYRDTYDRGFKRGFMGYIGLLLNAPYKIDSIVWMRLVLISFVVVFSFFLFFCWLYEPRGILGMWALK